MATNQPRYIRNIDNPGKLSPTIVPGNFAAGSTQEIKVGEIIEHTGNTNTEWVPINSDYSPNADGAIAAEEIKDGDRAGYYGIYLICPGDVWEFDLATAAATIIGADMFYSDSETFAASGSNQIATAVGDEHYPQMQGHLASFDGQGDAGTTIRSIGTVQVTFLAAFSWRAAVYQE